MKIRIPIALQDGFIQVAFIVMVAVGWGIVAGVAVELWAEVFVGLFTDTLSVVICVGTFWMHVHKRKNVRRVGG